MPPLAKTNGEPAKMSLLNLDDDDPDEFEVQYNPNSHAWSGEANYAKKMVVGGTSEVAQFTGNPDENSSITLWFDATDAQSFEKLDFARKFLTSLTRPRRNPSSIAQNTPPDVLVSWPGVRSSIVKITSWEAMEDFFDNQGNPLRNEIKLNYFEVFVERVSSNDVLENGLFRSSVEIPGFEDTFEIG